MVSLAANVNWSSIEEILDAYEQARATDRATSLSSFLPERDHPLRAEAMRELVRVDLEYAFNEGSGRTLESYRHEFPELFDNLANLSELAFEEYRLRLQSGEPISPDSYRLKFGVDIDSWPSSWRKRSTVGMQHDFAWDSKLDLDQAKGLSGDREPQIERVASRIPEVGETYLGFLLEAELARGGFGRVFLARQGDLASRPVVLKVASELLDESQTLAQLQHTHIMPIFSAHRDGGLQAVCMPYFGRATLSDPDALEPEQPGFPDRVARAAAEIADALEHAHQRGIVHRDIKPANLLIADDGRALVLDFNLSTTSKPVPGEPGTGQASPSARIGGTLPYMAPEQLTAFVCSSPRPADPRSDLYSLGVVLFESLTRRSPFPDRRGPLAQILPQMIADRAAGPVKLNWTTKVSQMKISPGFAAVVEKCLEADPARRYQSAAQLREDLLRHLADQPLKHARNPSTRELLVKWARRHPLLCSSAGMATLAVMLITLAGLGWWSVSSRLARWEAHGLFDHFEKTAREVHYRLNAPETSKPGADEARSLGRAALASFGIGERHDWYRVGPAGRLDRDALSRLRGEAGELLFELARVEQDPTQALVLDQQAMDCFSVDQTPRALLRQGADHARLAGQPGTARRWVELADQAPPRTARDLTLQGVRELDAGRREQALTWLRQARRQDPTDPFAWLALGSCLARMGNSPAAAEAFGACSASDPLSAWPYYYRGLMELALRQPDQARADFDRAIASRPNFAEAHFNRAIALESVGDLNAALQDLNEAIRLGLTATRVHFVRSSVRKKLGDAAGAAADHSEGLRRSPSDPESFVARGVARLRDGADPAVALADFEQALRLDPSNRAALENIAHVQSEKQNRPAAAIETLDRLIQLYPDFAPARAGRGVLLARAGRREEALADAREAARRDPQPLIQYQAADVYALTSRSVRSDRAIALGRLAVVFDLDPSWKVVAATDPDLDPLRDLEEFRELLMDSRSAKNPR